MKGRHMKAVACLVVAFVLAPAGASARAFFDPGSATWRFAYLSTITGQTANEAFTLHSLTAPEVVSSVVAGSNSYRYVYSAINGPSGLQPISSLWLRSQVRLQPSLPPNPDNPKTKDEEGIKVWMNEIDVHVEAARRYQGSVITSPSGWMGSIALHQQPTHFGWHWRISGDSVAPGVLPGRSAGGFRVTLPHWPGVVLMRVRGYSETVDIPSDLPMTSDRILQALDHIDKNDNLWVPVLAPALEPAEPFDAGVMVQRLRTHVATWPALGVASTDFVGRADRQLDALGLAVQRSNVVSAKAAVAEILKLVTESHPAQSQLPGAAAVVSTARTQPLPNSRATGAGTFAAPSTPAVHAVAAAALRVNLAQLLARSAIPYP
jgi:hypothetical protein